MCGLAGFTGDFNADPNKIRILLMENESRGSQSTGVYGKKMMKKVSPASIFVRDPNFNWITSTNIVIGHTRMPTSMNRDKAHAHPFAFGDKTSDSFIVGSHNGSVFNEYEMEKKIPGFTRSDVDSKSIYSAMHLTGDKEIFSMVEGHLALAFRYGNRVYLFRRESRPLFIGKAKEGWYWSSIKEGLLKIGIPEEKIYRVNPDVLLEFRGSKILTTKRIKEQRVKLTEHQTSYSWDTGLSDELKEELTGKKQYTPVGYKTHQQSTMSTTGVTKANGPATSQAGAIQLFGKNPLSRIMSAIQLREARTPRLSGKNILIPITEKVTEKDHDSYIIESISSIVEKQEDFLSVMPNMFRFGKHSPFWLKDTDQVVKGNIYTFPQQAEKTGPTAIDSLKVEFNPLMYSENKVLFQSHRNGLFLSVVIESPHKDNNTEVFSISKLLNQSVAYYPLSSRNERGYIEVDVPFIVTKCFDDGMIRMRLAIIDVNNPCFMFETYLSLEKESRYKFTIVPNITLEHAFSNGASSAAKRYRGENTTLLNQVYAKSISLACEIPTLVDEIVKSGGKRTVYQAISISRRNAEKEVEDGKKKWDQEITYD